MIQRPSRRARQLLTAAILLGFLLPVQAHDTNTAQSPPGLEVFFSPDGGCTTACVREIQRARQSVRVQAYSFTSAPIAKALLEAHKRGVSVEVILDKSQRSERYSSADFLAHAGICTMIDAQHAIAHNKVIVIDDAVVLTGSFNFTKAAEEKNAENLLVIRSLEVTTRCLANSRSHFDHTTPYHPR